MDVYEALLERCSIRSFTKEPISDEDLKKLLEVARWAPTGGNRQPWEFIAVRDKNRISSIKMFSEGLFGTPTLIIAVCAPDDRRITLFDLGMATENIMIQCVELSLGSCAIASFNPAPIKKILEIPNEVRLLMLLSIGYPDGEPRKRPKKELSKIAFNEIYGQEFKH
jgi:nitroreductase